MHIIILCKQTIDILCYVELGLKNLTLTVREASTPRQYGNLTKGPPHTPQYYSAVMYEGFQGGVSISPP